MTTGYNKIFFHMSSQGVRTGWGELVRECDAAGIPVSVASVGGEGMGDIIGAWDNGSVVEHVPVYRINGPDVPPYGAPIKPAAADWWAWQKASFSDDIIRYSDRVVIKHGNELARIHSDWLGEFFTEVATLAMNDPDGPFITAPFGWSTGTPELEHWLTPGMQKYLQFCNDYPEWGWVCVHEYSLNRNDIWAASPFRVGRFKMLFEVCDSLGLRRPNVVIHEFGWELGDIPDTQAAMEQINEVAGLYAYYPQIKGAGLWTTQPYNNTGIQYQVGALIPHVKDLTLNARYEVGDVPTPEPKHKVVVYKIAQEHTKDQWEHIAGLAHDDYKRTQTASHDDAETMYLEGNDESYIVVIDPEFPSQQHAIQYFDDLGYEYQVKYVFDAPPPDPDFVYTEWPTIEQRVTQSFGARPEYYEQFGFPGHEGIDIAAPMDSPIKAPAAGVVTRVTDKTTSGASSNYGWHVIIDHGNGYESLLGHLAYIPIVSVGDQVIAGQVIGLSGNTGLSTGPHLHLTLKKDGHVTPGWECCPGYIDPWPFLQPVQIPPGLGPELDLVPYLMPSSERGPLYEVETKVNGVSQGQQRHQSHRDNMGAEFFHTKGGDGPNHPAEWEQLDALGGYIRRYTDTSMGGGRYYDLTKQTDGSPFVNWIPRNMRVGQVYASEPLVTVKQKDNCDVVSGPNATTDYLKLAGHHQDFVGYNGIVLHNVIELHWSKSPGFEKIEEIYFYSKDPRAEGLVGWGSATSGKLAAVSELHDPGQRPDNVRETGCFS